MNTNERNGCTTITQGETNKDHTTMFIPNDIIPGALYGTKLMRLWRVLKESRKNTPTMIADGTRLFSVMKLLT